MGGFLGGHFGFRAAVGSLLCCPLRCRFRKRRMQFRQNFMFFATFQGRMIPMIQRSARKAYDYFILFSQSFVPVASPLTAFALRGTPYHRFPSRFDRSSPPPVPSSSLSPSLSSSPSSRSGLYLFVYLSKIKYIRDNCRGCFYVYGDRRSSRCDPAGALHTAPKKHRLRFRTGAVRHSGKGLSLT